MHITRSTMPDGGEKTLKNQLASHVRGRKSDVCGMQSRHSKDIYTHLKAAAACLISDQPISGPPQGAADMETDLVLWILSFNPQKAFYHMNLDPN
jgi:hypothetical protein